MTKREAEVVANFLQQQHPKGMYSAKEEGGRWVVYSAELGAVAFVEVPEKFSTVVAFLARDE